MSISLCTPLCLSVFVVSVCVFYIPTPSACFPFIPSSPGSRGAVVIGNVLSGRQSRVALRPAVVPLLLLVSTESLSRASPCTVSPPRGRRSCQSLSMSLYFLRRMETWSLNRTGSSLIWEWTSGMAPNQLVNLFMQVCRWAKWSGSAQRDAREDCWEAEKTALLSGFFVTLAQ